MTLLNEALALLRELRPHAPIESAWLTDPNAAFDEEAWRNSPLATSSKMRDRIDALLARAEKETQVTPQHVCGLRGFGAPSDVCPACATQETSVRPCMDCAGQRSPDGIVLHENGCTFLNRGESL